MSSILVPTVNSQIISSQPDEFLKGLQINITIKIIESPTIMLAVNIHFFAILETIENIPTYQL
jgi:hypothetical protein